MTGGDRELHRTLLRQLRRFGLSCSAPPAAAQWEGLLGVISASYDDADNDRYTLERSIEISSAEMRALHDELIAQARHDKLTGLPNRAALLESLVVALPSARRAERPLALLFVDLDQFKLVNDRFGHAAGDHLLRTFAARTRVHLRDVDVAARLGGDEFAILLPETDASGAETVAERLRQSLPAPPVAARNVPMVTASFGVAQHVPGEAGDDLLRRADVALYEAKSRGRDRVVRAPQPQEDPDFRGGA
jgi:diguanylate cyclase (GGDEF)-like protein